MEIETRLENTVKQRIAGLYARVSTARQEDQATIDSQIDEIRKRIEADGNILPPENIFIDDGWTGEMLQRPGLDAARDAGKEGSYQVIYVYDRGRLSRNFVYQEIILEELLNLDIKFVTLHDVKAETPEEQVLQAMQGVFQQYERVKIVDRMRRGKMFKASHGILINGQSLYGYNYIKKTETEPAKYEINKEQAEIVRKIFYWVGMEGVSIREVIRRLYDMGVPTKKRKSPFWTRGPLVRLLGTETYFTGVIHYNKSEAIVAKNPIKNDKYRKVKKGSRRVRPKVEWLPFDVPKILPNRFLFDKIQKVLEYNKKFRCKTKKYPYLLSGLAFCECGFPRVGDGIDKSNFYYRCAERIYKFPLEKKCTSQGINAVVLDTCLWNELQKFLSDPALLRKYAEEWYKVQMNNEATLDQKARFEVLIKKAEEEEVRYARAYGEGSLEFDQLKELMKETSKKKLTYKAKLEELIYKDTQGSISQFKVDELCEEAQKVIKTLDTTNKEAVIRDIITKVVIKGGTQVEVWGNIPLFDLNMGYESTSRDSWTS